MTPPEAEASTASDRDAPTPAQREARALVDSFPYDPRARDQRWKDATSNAGPADWAHDANVRSATGGLAPKLTGLPDAWCTHEVALAGEELLRVWKTEQGYPETGDLLGDMIIVYETMRLRRELLIWGLPEAGSGTRRLEWEGMPAWDRASEVVPEEFSYARDSLPGFPKHMLDVMGIFGGLRKELDEMFDETGLPEKPDWFPTFTTNEDWRFDVKKFVLEDLASTLLREWKGRGYPETGFENGDVSLAAIALVENPQVIVWNPRENVIAELREIPPWPET